jgi:hypothetical protein
MISHLKQKKNQSFYGNYLSSRFSVSLLSFSLSLSFLLFIIIIVHGINPFDIDRFWYALFAGNFRPLPLLSHIRFISELSSNYSHVGDSDALKLITIELSQGGKKIKKTPILIGSVPECIQGLTVTEIIV